MHEGLKSFITYMRKVKVNSIESLEFNHLKDNFSFKLTKSNNFHVDETKNIFLKFCSLFFFQIQNDEFETSFVEFFGDFKLLLLSRGKLFQLQMCLKIVINSFP